MRPGHQKFHLPGCHWILFFCKYCRNHRIELGVLILVFVLVFLYTIKPDSKYKTIVEPTIKTTTIKDRVHPTTLQFNEDSPIACMNFKGRLGNIIIEYAFLYIISKLKGLYPVIPEDFQLLNIFEVKKTTLSAIGKSQHECSKAEFYKERWPCSFDPKMMEVPVGKSARFDGFFQSWKYWTNHEKELKKVFTFKSEIREKASKQFSDILKKFKYKNSPDDIIVSIHARRGDYLSKQDRDVGKITPNVSYYLNAMNFYRKRYTRVYFMMASDSIEWAKKYLGSQPYIHFSEGNSPAEDIALMSKANHTIMSVGTFGWIIGWLAGGTTIHYEKFFVPGSSYAKDFKNGNMSEFIYPGWISME